MENNTPVSDQESSRDVKPGMYDISYTEGGRIVGFNKMDGITNFLDDRRETREARRGKKESDDLRATVLVYDTPGGKMYLLNQARTTENGTIDDKKTMVGNFLTPDQIEAFKDILASRGK